MMNLGVIKVRMADPDGRLWPCACHTEPSQIFLVTIVPGHDDGIYVVVPLVDFDTPPMARASLENAMDTLEYYCSEAQRLGSAAAVNFG